jgi:hypothetical protein
VPLIPLHPCAMLRALVLLAGPALLMAAAAAAEDVGGQQTHPLVHGALLLAAVGLAAGAAMLLTWVCVPVREAKRLAAEVDPAQEDTYAEPSAGERWATARGRAEGRRALTLWMNGVAQADVRVAERRKGGAHAHGRHARVQ